MYLRQLTACFIRLSLPVSKQQRNFRRKVDPGISKRKSLLANDNKDLEELNDYDFDLEADFTNVNKSYEQHMQEIDVQGEREKYMIVKQKYFKQKTPNFLTWNDKQQIRYLYNTNPEEWTIEKLSEGFPALPDIIAKIVKGNWTKKNENKIEHHDDAVQQNWKLFKGGKLNDLPKELAEHLNKFTNRDLQLKPFKIPEKIVVQHNNVKNMLPSNIKIGTEFSGIIKSYQKLKQIDNTQESNIPNKKKIEKPPDEDTYLLGKINKYKQHVTLENLENKIKEKAKRGKISPDEKIMLASSIEKTEITTPVTLSSKDINIRDTTKYATKELSANVKSDPKKYEFLEYPEKIIIPKGKLKRGYTYKLNDCYYDDDGEFLYRVPGMY